MTTRWLVKNYGQKDLFASLLKSRSIKEEELIPHYEMLYDPFLLKGCRPFVDLILDNQKKKAPLTIFGDYDADGITAGVLLQDVLNWLGIESELIIPTRQQGYGLSVEAVQYTSKKGGLLITVDNGITANQEFRLAKKLGLTTAIIDHHLPLEALPQADVIIDPHQTDCPYPFKGLSACGLVFKVCSGLLMVQKNRDNLLNRLKWLLDLVAIATVADMVPLVDENRILVHWGLVVLKKTRRAGLRAITQTASLKTERIDEMTLGFVFGPRLNAAGRLNENKIVQELLTVSSLEQALPLSLKLEKLNKKRLEQVKGISDEAAELFERSLRSENLPIIVLAKDSWPSGVVGLVANSLSGSFNRPAVIGAIEGNLIKASARSIAGYHIVQALSDVGYCLKSFGGHQQAAGLTIATDRWAVFEKAIINHARQNLKESDLVKTLVAEAVVGARQLTDSFVEKLERLRPYGVANPQPLYLLERLTVVKTRVVGNSHLKIFLRQGSNYLEGIYFGAPQALKQDLLKGTVVDLIAKVTFNNYTGTRRIVLEIVDLKRSPSLYEFIDG